MDPRRTSESLAVELGDFPTGESDAPGLCMLRWTGRLSARKGPGVEPSLSIKAKDCPMTLQQKLLRSVIITGFAALASVAVAQTGGGTSGSASGGATGGATGATGGTGATGSAGTSGSAAAGTSSSGTSTSG